MNTKDYIETKKSKKLSDIFKGVLAVGLVVGSMVTSTACKPNQPHESSSSTSTIETTTTTQQTTTTETPSTTETTKIDEPIIRTDEKAEELKATIDAYYEKDVESKSKRIKMGRYFESNQEPSCSFEICERIGEDLSAIETFDISEEEYEYIKGIYQNISGSSDISGIHEFQFPLSYIIKNFDDKTFDILMNAILAKQSTNQSSQDDLVR